MPARTRASASDVHDRLRSDVMRGAFVPGERLKFAPLTERYGSSVSVVREALTRLSQQGLVESEPNVGFRVRPVSLDDLHDLTATRVAIESIALRRAVEVGDTAWEARLVAAHHTLARTPIHSHDAPGELSDEWETAHHAFHAALLEGAGGRWMQDLAHELRYAADFYRRWSQLQEPDRDPAAEHAAILDAVLARDADRAVDLLAEHYQRTARIVEGSLGADA